MPVISAGLVGFVPIERSVREALIAFGAQADFWGIKWCFLSAAFGDLYSQSPPVLFLKEQDKICSFQKGLIFKCSCSLIVHPHCWPRPTTHLWSLIDFTTEKCASCKRKSSNLQWINVIEQLSNWYNYHSESNIYFSCLKASLAVCLH